MIEAKSKFSIACEMRRGFDHSLQRCWSRKEGRIVVLK